MTHVGCMTEEIFNQLLWLITWYDDVFKCNNHLLLGLPVLRYNKWYFDLAQTISVSHVTYINGIKVFCNWLRAHQCFVRDYAYVPCYNTMATKGATHRAQVHLSIGSNFKGGLFFAKNNVPLLAIAKPCQYER